MASVLGVVFALYTGDAYAFEAGAAKVELAPPLGAPLNGYGNRMGRGATATHDPLWARCLYMSDDQTRVFLVNTDLCLITRELRAKVLEKAPSEVPKENIILTATHTHNGPGGMSHSLIFRMVSGRYMPELVDATAEKIAQAMREAYAARKPAVIGYATGKQQDLSVNRRQPKGPVDEQVGVILAKSLEGPGIAIVANFAAHPTSVPEDLHYAYSADYPGVYYRELEALAEPGCVAMFINGAEGNQTISDPQNRSGFARTESVGKLLAERVKAISNTIDCTAAPLRLATATVALPPSLASSFAPSETTLQVLEIGGLVMTFFPGEPCVEIGLELRKQTLARGYDAQFSVGLANDYVGYFVPRELYGQLTYESTMSFYGPGMADWFYREFPRLMSRGGKPSSAADPVSATVRDIGEGKSVVLSGSHFDIGYARGRAFRDDIIAAYERDVVAPVKSGEAIPKDGLWMYAPSFVDLTPLALPRLGIGARALLSGMADDGLREIEGLSAGAGLPFDAAWLLQCAPVMASRDTTSAFYRSPFCTMFAVMGPRTGPSRILVGRNLDWDASDVPVVAEVRPEKGRAYLSVGFPWNLGVFTGMNTAGIVVCAERSEALGTPSTDGPPVEFVLREVLQESDDMKEALARLQAAGHVRGYRVLVAEPSKPSARVIEYGRRIVVREPKDDILLGGVPTSSEDEEEVVRYERVAELLGMEGPIGTEQVAQVLGDRLPEAGDGSILNARTRHSVVFSPTTRTALVAFPGADGGLGKYRRYGFEGEGQ